MNTNGKMNLNVMVKISLLSVIAFIIMFMEFPIPLFPPFLKLDLSDLPALIASFAFGPMAGILTELVKNILHLFKTDTAGVGELANFIIGASLVAPAGWIYSKNRTKKGAFIGMAVGTVCMVIGGILANMFIIMPFYSKVMPIEAIIEMAAAANTAIVDMNTLILFAIAPFNLLKGILVSVITALIYKYVHRLLDSATFSKAGR